MKLVRYSPLLLALVAGVAYGQDAQPDAGLPVAPVAGAPIELLAAAPELAVPGVIETGIAAVRGVRLEMAALKALRAGQSFTLTPEPGVTLVCLVLEARQQTEKVFVLQAMVGQQEGAATFAVYEEAAAMTLRVHLPRGAYSLHYQGGGQGAEDLYHVWKLDEAALPPEGDVHDHGPPEPPLVRGEDDDDWIPDAGGYIARDGNSCTGSRAVFDTMVLYTPAARADAGGTSAIRAIGVLAVEHANTAYIASGNSCRARLVYCNEIAYVEGPDQGDDLSRLRGTADGFMDGIHATRDTINADFVALFNNQGTGNGYCPGGAPTYAGSPFSTSRWTRAAATFTHAHETGHNLGCGHNVADGGACGPSYGVGWQFFGTDGNGYCTVLAYPDSTFERVLHFSNPDVNFMGTPTGRPIGGPNEADNSNLIAVNDATVAGFEGTRYDVYIDFGYGGIEVGTYTFPYNTVPEGVAAIDVPEVGAGESPNLFIDAGSTTWTGTISKEMSIIACSGAVTIGD